MHLDIVVVVSSAGFRYVVCFLMYRLTCGQMRKKLLEDAKLEKTLSAFESNTTQTSDSVLQRGSSKEFLGPNDDKSSEEE